MVFEINGKELKRILVNDEDLSIDFKVNLKEGKQQVKAYFILSNDKQLGVTYATFTKI